MIGTILPLEYVFSLFFYSINLTEFVNLYHFFVKLSFYFGFLSPTIILIIVNSLIIHKATQYSRSQKPMGKTPSRIQSERKKAQMTRMILFITSLFISVSFPIQLYAAYFFVNVSQLYYGPMITNIMGTIQFAYPCFQFFILLFSNKLFFNEAKTIILSIRNRQKVDISSLSSIRGRHIIDKNMAEIRQA